MARMFPRSAILDALSPIPVTGERTGPGIPSENYWFHRHVAAYQHLAPSLRGLRVLDAGSGEGYGAAMLAAGGAHVTGVDVDGDIVQRAQRRYRGARFEHGDVEKLAWPDRAFDAVVSIQVIEHLKDAASFLRECARVLVPGGLCAVVTPNRLTFSPHGSGHAFHTREFAPDELRALCGSIFARCSLLGLVHGPRLGDDEKRAGRTIAERLLEKPPSAWSAELNALVESVRAEDFRFISDGEERWLDVVAVCSV